MSQIPSENGVFSFAYGASLLGISAVSFFTVFKAFEACRRVRRRTIRTLDEVDTLNRIVEEKEVTIRALQQTLDAATVDVRNKDDLLAIARQEIQQTRKRLAEVEQQLERTRDQNRNLADQVKSQAKEIKTAKDETAYVKTQLTQTSKLLEDRTLELKGAQLFLTKTDVGISGADIINMVQVLNTEVLQTSAFMAEGFEFGEPFTGEEDDEDPDLASAYAHTTELLGPTVTDLLRKTRHRDDPTLVQIAFQASVSTYAEWMISSWYFENSGEEQFLSQIYDKIRDSEEQAVSGRWRALTRKHVQEMFETEPELTAYFVEAFVNILLVSGCRSNSADLQNTIMERYGDRLVRVVQLAVRLNKAIGEGVTSCEMEAVYVQHDTPYDPEAMDDAFENESGKDKDRGKGKEKEKADNLLVLCTTELGLLRSERGQKDWGEVIMLKPKIVLESVLEEMMMNA